MKWVLSLFSMCSRWDHQIRRLASSRRDARPLAMKWISASCWWIIFACTRLQQHLVLSNKPLDPLSTNFLRHELSTFVNVLELYGPFSLVMIISAQEAHQMQEYTALGGRTRTKALYKATTPWSFSYYQCFPWWWYNTSCTELEAGLRKAVRTSRGAPSIKTLL